MTGAVHVSWALALCACGRLGFEAQPDAATTVDDAQPDAMQGDLIAYYPLDGLDGTTLRDASGYGHDGACTMCPVAEPGIRTMALRFDGSTDMIVVPSTTVLDGLTAYTVSFWARRDQVPATGAGCLVSKREGSATANSFQVCIEDTLEIFYASSNTTYHSTVMLDTTWHHIALAWSAALGQEALYVDRALVLDNPVSKSFDTGDIVFGADIDGAGPVAYFSGWLDEIRIYNRVLDIAEIIALGTP